MARQPASVAPAGTHPRLPASWNLGLRISRLLAGIQDEHDGRIDDEDVRLCNDPVGRCPARSVVFRVSGWCSVCRDFGDGRAGGGFVDDGLVGGEGGDEGSERKGC
jgi:hypothetical protein